MEIQENAIALKGIEPSFVPSGLVCTDRRRWRPMISFAGPVQVEMRDHGWR